VSVFGYQVIADELVARQVTAVFGVLGNANLMLGYEIENGGHGRFVAAANEAGAVMMARGLAETTGQVGVVTTTCGPGFVNSLTALTECVRARAPMVLVTADAPVTDEPTLQGVRFSQAIGQSELAAQVGAGFCHVGSSSDVAADVHRAFARARAERRPWVLSAPFEIMYGECTAQRGSGVSTDPSEATADEASLDAAVGCLASARRPLILAGRGALGARKEIMELSDVLGAVLCTTALGSGMFDGAPGDIGLFGTLAAEEALPIIAQSDCVISFGASLNSYTTDGGRLLTGKRVIQCDIMPDALNRFQQSDVVLHGDSSRTCNAVADMLRQVGFVPSSFRAAAPPRSARSGQLVLQEDGTAKPDSVPGWLSAVLPRPRTLVFDAGRFLGLALQVAHAPTGAAVATHSFGSIGLGMGAAIGAAVGGAPARAVLITGDGGFMLNGVGELNTAVRESLDLIVIMLNDAAYGAEHRHLAARGLDPSIITFDWPNFAAVARALGADAVEVRSDQDAAAAAEEIARTGRSCPLLVELFLDAQQLSSAH
jgi:acetolactate synthase I/II/III large subunit